MSGPAEVKYGDPLPHSEDAVSMHVCDVHIRCVRAVNPQGRFYDWDVVAPGARLESRGFHGRASSLRAALRQARKHAQIMERRTRP